MPNTDLKLKRLNNHASRTNDYVYIPLVWVYQTMSSTIQAVVEHAQLFVCLRIQWHNVRRVPWTGLSMTEEILRHSRKKLAGKKKTLD